MSRSYKKTPIIKSGGYGGPDGKRYANRALRRRQLQDDIMNGRAFKKFYSSWEINDYICRCSKKEAIEEYNKIISLANDLDCSPWLKRWAQRNLKKYPTLEDYLEENWEKNFRRK